MAGRLIKKTHRTLPAAGSPGTTLSCLTSRAADLSLSTMKESSPLRIADPGPLSRLTISRSACILLALLAQTAACAGGDAFERVLAHNLEAQALFVPAVLDSLLAAEAPIPTAQRVGLWARRFLADPDSEYRFGLKEGGYVADGLIVSDHRQDCVSLIYRCSELARARDHRDAIAIALATRFAGAPHDSLIDAEGRVNYDRPEHLDYSLDMIRSGHWGRDITSQLSGARPDSLGTARYPAGSFLYVPGAELVPRELREGDIVWFVLNPANSSARRLRDEQGVAIGHIGLAIEEAGAIQLVHAASSALPGAYEGGRVVRVPLQEYLARVERFAGIMVTRF